MSYVQDVRKPELREAIEYLSGKEYSFSADFTPEGVPICVFKNGDKSSAIFNMDKISFAHGIVTMANAMKDMESKPNG